MTTILREAFLLDLENCGWEEEPSLLAGETDYTGKGYPCTLPAQVHEILVRHGVIANPVLTHDGAECERVSRRDWCYAVPFDRPSVPEGGLSLQCMGLDTLADVYLNGCYLGSHKDMFIPFEADISHLVRTKNLLLFHFHSPVRYVEEYPIPPEEKAFIKPSHYLRKATHDFESSLGLKPFFAGIGIFDEVRIVEHGPAEVLTLNPRYSLNENLKEATLNLEVVYSAQTAGFMMEVQVDGPDGECLYKEVRSVPPGGPQTETVTASLPDIRLWWPVGYGAQPLYRVQVRLIKERTVFSEMEKEIGFRKIIMEEPFHFRVNGVKVRLWGANLVPVSGLTHCFDEKRASKILRLAKEANMNTLRVWGGGEPLPERFYSMADREGFLLWAEFFHKWGMSPENGEFLSLYRKEAETLVCMARSHPSVLLWCGGNESQMGAQRDFPDKPFIGGKIFRMYGEICAKLDPERPYWPNSPYGGAFYNDPSAGDFHGWNHLWYFPGTDYPVMFSENSRVSPPGPKTMRRYLPLDEDFWPAGFQSSLCRHEDSLLPPAWMKLKVGPEPYWCSPVEQFYDAKTPEELAYRCGMAHGQFMKRCGERLKQGRLPDGEKQICMGQLIWKLNDSWPQVFCGLLDYYLEPYIPYYCIKRAFEPVQVSFSIGGNIRIWGVNDTAQALDAQLAFALYDPVENRVLHREERAVRLPAGESAVLMNLDHLYQFRRRDVLYASLSGAGGEILARNYDFVEIERNLYFPPARLTLRRTEEGVEISADQFARCIELSGNAEGDEFGFFYEDNYFDLMPFETRTIRVTHPSYSSFELKAKAHYSPYTQTIHI